MTSAVHAANYYTCSQIPFCYRFRDFESSQLDVTFIDPPTLRPKEVTTRDNLVDFLHGLEYEF